VIYFTLIASIVSDVVAVIAFFFAGSIFTITAGESASIRLVKITSETKFYLTSTWAAIPVQNIPVVTSFNVWSFRISASWGAITWEIARASVTMLN